MKAAPKTTADWERIETQFRVGSLSLREIAAEHSITEGAIRKRAKRDGWERDLTEKVRAKADALVRKELVRSEVRAESASEKQTIEVEAQVQARIRLGHRTDINRSRRLAMTLLEELETQTASGPELASLGQMMASPDEKGVDKLNDLYQKVISLPGRTKVMKDLGDTLKTLIALEREAYGLGDPAQDALDALAGLAVRFVDAPTS